MMIIKEVSKKKKRKKDRERLSRIIQIAGVTPYGDVPFYSAFSTEYSSTASVALGAK